jgi:hypothetical protein
MLKLKDYTEVLTNGNNYSLKYNLNIHWKKNFLTKKSILKTHKILRIPWINQYFRLLNNFDFFFAECQTVIVSICDNFCIDLKLKHLNCISNEQICAENRITTRIRNSKIDYASLTPIIS